MPDQLSYEKESVLPVRHLAGAVAAVVLLAACRTRHTDDDLKRTIANLEGTNEELSLRIDELTTERAGLKQRVKSLEAQVEKHDQMKKAVEDVKGEISAEVRKVIEQFQVDADIEVERAPGGYRLVLREAVLFPTGSATLTDDGRKALEKVAGAIRGGVGRVSVEGHTDDVRIAKPETLKLFPRGNMDLSVQRALAVWEFLVNEGKVAETRLSVSGYGPHRPRVPNTSEPNRWMNRRVEIRVAEE